MLVETGHVGTAASDGIPVFLVAGMDAVGEFTCAECSYGVTVRRLLPTCPMCGGNVWEPLRSHLALSR
jgi:hypothetical protein